MQKNHLSDYNRGVQANTVERKGDLMAKQSNSLAHTKWLCKYHIVFTPKYRRKLIYNQYKEDLRDIIKQLCGYKGVEILGQEISAKRKALKIRHFEDLSNGFTPRLHLLR